MREGERERTGGGCSKTNFDAWRERGKGGGGCSKQHVEKARADRQVEREDGRVGQAREGEEGCERGRTREVSRQEGGGMRESAMKQGRCR